MEIVAKLNNLRISPRKVRLVAGLVRGKTAAEARAFLSFCVKKGALPFKKLFDSAVANAKNNFHLKEEELCVASIKVDEGRKLKRWRARARGRACRIEKKTSNITLCLTDNSPYKLEKDLIGKNIVEDKLKIKRQKVKIQSKNKKEKKMTPRERRNMVRCERLAEFTP